MKAATRPNYWPHRLAVVLCCATFPLIWVGGLVTTYQAGMAVPDWPTTYGYNLLLYPWTTWVFGPWDLFIEHGHRLLGVLVGALTVALVAVVWCCDERRWLRVLSAGALGLVILQGLLGGARVLLDDRLLAMIHGCTGPAFFAYCIGIAVCTSEFWHRGPVAAFALPGRKAESSPLPRLVGLTLLFSYLQLVAGALLRHLPVTATPTTFQMVVWFHLLNAVILAGHVVYLTVVTCSSYWQLTELRTPVLILAALLAAQFCLGIATWVVKYGWPAWFAGFQLAAEHTIRANSFSQATVITAHVAMGSLILATSSLLAVRSLRVFRGDTAALGSGAFLLGIAT